MWTRALKGEKEMKGRSKRRVEGGRVGEEDRE
jgi:hypothetical protein